MTRVSNNWNIPKTKRRNENCKRNYSIVFIVLLNKTIKNFVLYALEQAYKVLHFKFRYKLIFIHQNTNRTRSTNAACKRTLNHVSRHKNSSREQILAIHDSRKYHRPNLFTGILRHRDRLKVLKKWELEKFNDDRSSYSLNNMLYVQCI